MKKKFDSWIQSWSDGSLLIYFTLVAVLQTAVTILVLG